jgi:hypothetical protein
LSNEARLEHYRRAGQLLIEAKKSEQVPHGSWGRWLKGNFELSQVTAGRALFVMTWYPIATLIVTVAGYLIGRKLLRW